MRTMLVFIKFQRWWKFGGLLIISSIEFMSDHQPLRPSFWPFDCSHFLRFTAWFLHKFLSCLLSAIVVNKGQMQMISQASKVSQLPLRWTHLICHLLEKWCPLVSSCRRTSLWSSSPPTAVTWITSWSHSSWSTMTSVRLTWLLGTTCSFLCLGWYLYISLFSQDAAHCIPISLSSSLMRGLGGFFIRRRLDKKAGEKDRLYRAILQMVSPSFSWHPFTVCLCNEVSWMLELLLYCSTWKSCSKEEKIWNFTLKEGEHVVAKQGTQRAVYCQWLWMLFWMVDFYFCIWPLKLSIWRYYMEWVCLQGVFLMPCWSLCPSAMTNCLMAISIENKWWLYWSSLSALKAILTFCVPCV